MSDLDNLRPEVRDALDKLEYSLIGTHNHNDFYAIRAELLRLAQESADLREADAFGLDPAAVEYRRRAERAEAELVALKERIADACRTDRGGVNNVSSNACSKG